MEALRACRHKLCVGMEGDAADRKIDFPRIVNNRSFCHRDPQGLSVDPKPHAERTGNWRQNVFYKV